MYAKILVDNIKKENMEGEWGLSVYIEFNDKKILLDAGASSLFVENAKKMNVDLSHIDYGFLSHAHYDHGNGIEAFFKENDKAKFYIQKSCGENCYKKVWLVKKYIGLPKGLLNNYSHRLEKVEGVYKVDEGIYVVSHNRDYSEIGKQEKMVLKTKNGWKYDNFSHEQSLVFDTDKGLVIFNSCSHVGAANIINEIKEVFEDKTVYAIIGGFHLFNKTDEFVKELAQKIKETGIQMVYTGHCTGQHAYDVLKNECKDMVNQLQVGLEINF